MTAAGHNRDRMSVMMLSVLEALYHTKKTTLAAEKLGIAQPSISVYLKQLRQLSGDELFIRTARGLEPTDFCHAYYLQAKEVLNSLDLLATAKNAAYDPAAASASFSVATTFLRGRRFFDAFSVQVMKQYPQVKVDMIYLAEGEAIDNIDAGLVDIFIGMVSEKLPKHFAMKKLGRTDLVVICSKKSRFFKTGRIGKAEYLDTPHVKATASFEPSLLDAKFKREGMLQKTLVCVPDIGAEVALLHETDYLLVLDRYDVEMIDNKEDFKILKTDFKIPQFDFYCVWHSRKDNHPAHRWYRDYILRAGGGAAS